MWILKNQNECFDWSKPAIPPIITICWSVVPLRILSTSLLSLGSGRCRLIDGVSAHLRPTSRLLTMAISTGSLVIHIWIGSRLPINVIFAFWSPITTSIVGLITWTPLLPLIHDNSGLVRPHTRHLPLTFSVSSG